MSLSKSFMLIGAFTFFACSTAKVRVMPGDDGVNRVVVRDIERDDAETAAVKAANEYCQERNQQAVFVSEKTDYKGDMDESTRNTVRNASKVAMILGSGARRHGNDPGDSVLRGAGTTGYGMTSDRDYQAEVHFKCQ